MIKTDDAQELAMLMDRAIKNTQIRAYVEEHTKDYLAAYSWDQVAQKVASVIFAGKK